MPTGVYIKNIHDFKDFLRGGIWTTGDRIVAEPMESSRFGFRNLFDMFLYSKIVVLTGLKELVNYALRFFKNITGCSFRIGLHLQCETLHYMQYIVFLFDLFSFYDA